MDPASDNSGDELCHSFKAPSSPIRPTDGRHTAAKLRFQKLSLPRTSLIQVPELKRAMGLTHLKDEHGKGVQFMLDQGTRRDKVKVLATAFVRR